MKTLIVTESFLPAMNGVTHCLLRVIENLDSHGFETLVVHPDTPGHDASDSSSPPSTQLLPLPSVALPGYPDVRVALGGVRRLVKIMREFQPDVVHLASPFVLGYRALLAAEHLGLPTVAVYQTEVPAYAARYGIPGVEAMLWQHVARLHEKATLTLAPSRHSIAQLRHVGVTRLKRWGRGVDTIRFHPGRRDESWREAIAAPTTKLIGYVGRLAAEKQVEDLAALAGIPGTRLVIVGDGPLRERLQHQLPSAHFAGFLGGTELATALASLDLFVHPGESETFCQTIQEAMASGVPVVATGRGGPIDLVDSSHNGWLYSPGDLPGMRERVLDLVGDDAKRTAFAAHARQTVLPRSWSRLCEQLIQHYHHSIDMARLTAAIPSGTKEPR